MIVCTIAIAIMTLYECCPRLEDGGFLVIGWPTKLRPNHRLNEDKLTAIIKQCLIDLDVSPEVHKRLKDEARAIARKARV